MMQSTTIQGLATVIYPVADLVRARDWYAAAFGQQPYFDQPFYVGFNIAGYELGLIPEASASADRPANSAAAGGVAYWRVPSLADAHSHFLSAGAVAVSAPQDVGDRIKVATVADPFGNTIGLIENPHFALPQS